MRWGTGTAAVFALALAACNGAKERATDAHAAASDAPPADAWIFPDAYIPPPPMDAAPPPAMTCDGDAGMCPLPPSTCADTHYLVYYTGGECAGGACSWTQNFMYCTFGCVNNGCSGGFT